MIRLTYSNNTEVLLDYLAQSIQFERQLKTPWEPIQLLVPNPTIKDYISIQIAHRLGITANLRFSYLEDIGQNLFAIKNCRILTNTLLNAALLVILGDNDSLAEDCLTPVRQYLSKDTTGLKLVQLASQLADLYYDYDISRPLWINAWRTNKYIKTQSHITEAWQRSIWLKAIDCLDRTGLRHLTLSEVATIPLDSINNLNLNVHVFGFTHVNQTYYQIFNRLGKLGNLHLYAINPCQEFWEDLTIDNEMKRQIAQDYNKQVNSNIQTPNESNNNSHGCHTLISNEPAVLHHWGRSGREGIRSLNNISQYDFETSFELPESTTLLGRIQKDILLFQNSSTVHEYTLDTNIQFWACPNQRREAEVLATEIWHLIELHSVTNQPMSFSDIAVVLPQNEEQSYIANIQAAFQETHDIPWTQKNSRPNVLTDMIEATKLLLNLPTSSITKMEIMHIITHPNIANHLGPINSKFWVELFNALDIICEVDTYNWSDTCKTTTSQEIQNTVVNDTKTHNRNNDHQSSATPGSVSIEYILTLARVLLDSANQLRNGYQDSKNWSINLKNYLSTWLLAYNETAILAIEQILNSLSKTLESAPAELPKPRLGYIAARFLATESLIKLRDQQPCELTGGVVVTNIDQICSIPFRAVFILGLNESAILTNSNHSSLNLRLKEREWTDITQSDKEHYSFVEILVLTKEYLYLSYVANDQLTGTSLEPSYLFKGLIAIAKDYLQTDPTIQYHPIHRFDPIYFPELFSTDKSTLIQRYNHSPIAQSEARAVWLGKHMRQAKPQLLTSSSSIKTDLFSSPILKNQAYTITSQHKKSISDSNDEMTLSIADLIRWLECPLTGAAAIKLGLHNDPISELPSVEDEPFKSHTLDNYALLREVTLYSTCHKCTLEKAYDIAIKNIEYQRKSQFELFAQIEKKSNLALIQSWLTLIDGLHPKIWHLDPKQLSNDTVKNHILPLSLKVHINGKERSINLVGNLRPQLWNGSIFFETGRPPKSNLEVIRKKALRAYVDQMLLSCITHDVVEHRAWFLFSGDEGKNPTIRSMTFKPVCEDQSQKLLNNWIQDLLENSHAMLMPIEAILAADDNKNITGEYIRDYVDSHVNNSSTDGFSSMYGPVPNIQNYAPPSNLTTIISNRLGDFLNQVHTFDASK